MPNKIKQIGSRTKVAKIIDEFKLVINKGREDGISEGERFLIYSIGEEILDPDTNKILGKLEVVKGTGKVTHVQDNISIISSDMKTSPHRTIRKKVGSPGFSTLSTILGGEREIEEILPSNSVEFDKPEVGDFAKKI
jgi:hypothetical protein